MPEDNELRLVTIFGNVPTQATQFEIVPPANVETIGSISNGSDQLTVDDVTGVTAGLYIYATGIPMGTQVDSVLGQIVTMTANATATLTKGVVIFYANPEDALLPLSAGQTIRFL